MGILEKIRGKIIVSCQGSAEVGNPFHTSDDMLQMAKAAYLGGCVGFRANTPSHVERIKKYYPDVPMVGIYKVVTKGVPVFITPTIEEVDVLYGLGCEVIAVDGTNRVNRNNEKGYEVIRQTKEKYPNQLVMADLATFEDARLSLEAGADIISTTLSGYTEDTKDKDMTVADFELITAIRKEFPNAFINAEGRIWTREDVKQAFEAGADVVTVGTAITNPMMITKRFVDFIYK